MALKGQKISPSTHASYGFCQIPYNPFFAGNLFLHFFASRDSLAKICLSNFVGAVLRHVHLSSHKCSFIIIMLSLYRYFKPIQKVPDPNGPLSSLVTTPVIQQANIKVSNVVEKTTQGNGGNE